MVDPNPYEPPGTPANKAPSRRNMGFMVLMAILSVPAGGIAFYASCYAAVAAVGADGSVNAVIGWGIFAGLVGGGLTMGTMLYYGVFRKPRKVNSGANER